MLDIWSPGAHGGHGLKGVPMSLGSPPEGEVGKLQQMQQLPVVFGFQGIPRNSSAIWYWQCRCGHAADNASFHDLVTNFHKAQLP